MAVRPSKLTDVTRGGSAMETHRDITEVSRGGQGHQGAIPMGDGKITKVFPWGAGTTQMCPHHGGKVWELLVSPHLSG